MRKFFYVEDYNGDTDLPKRKTKKSAGYDIVAPETVFIQPHKYVIIPTNIKVALEDNEFLQVVSRSSLYKKHNLIMVNSVGIIDADYFENPDNDGNIGVILLNDSNYVQVIGKNEAFAQGIIMEYKVTDDDNATGERVGGYGSTDKVKQDNNYHDKHYAEMKVQPIEVMQKMLTPDEFVGFLKGNVIKYHLRAGHKAGESDSKDNDKRDRYMAWLDNFVTFGNVDPRRNYDLNYTLANKILFEIDKIFTKMLGSTNGK